MNRGRVILLLGVTFATIIIAGFFFGLSQMGDCFPEPAALRECLDAKRTAGNVVLVVAATLYAGAVALIIRRGKKL